GPGPRSRHLLLRSAIPRRRRGEGPGALPSHRAPGRFDGQKGGRPHLGGVSFLAAVYGDGGPDREGSDGGIWGMMETIGVAWPFASSPLAAPLPRHFGVEAFRYSRRRGLRPRCGGQYRLSFSECRAGPRRSGESRSGPATPIVGRAIMLEEEGDE